jgi:lysyl-tRNA synthetase class 2
MNDWHAFQSRHLNGGSYDAESRMLTIQFTNGAVYQYANVPQTVADSLFQTGSSQDYFNDKIRSVYPFTKIADGQTRSGRRSARRY